MNSLRARAARPADIPQVVRWLPHILRHPKEYALFVVEKEERLAGFGAMRANLIVWRSAPGFTPSEVLPPLLELFRDKATQAGAASLYTAEAFSEESEEAAVLERLGFERRAGFIYTEFDPRRSFPLFERGLELLRRQNRIPSDAKVVPLRNAPAIAVRNLVTSYLGSDLPEVASAADFYFDKSRVALMGPKVVGAILMELRNGPPPYPLVTRMAIDRAFRGTWAYVLLAHAVHVEFINCGFTRVVSKTDPGNHAGIINFIRRAKGREIGREYHFEQSLHAHSLPGFTHSEHSSNAASDALAGAAPA